MAITSDTLSLGFLVSGVSFSTDVDVGVNVFRRREDIVYSQYTDQDRVNISFYTSKEISPNNSLFIRDRSASMIENRVRLDSGFTVITTATYSVDTDRFLVTDVFAENVSMASPKPLFFVHVLNRTDLPRQSNTDDTLAANTQLLEVQLLDRLLNPLQTDSLVIDKNKGYVYSNLNSSFDFRTGDYSAYYVKYSLKFGQEILTYTELLSNVPAYKEADPSDLESDLSIIQDGRKVYILTEVENGFEVTLPISTAYAFKVDNSSKISIDSLPDISTDNPWKLSISNGKFFSTVSGVDYKYHVGEIDTQQWDPENPIKKVVAETSLFVSKSIFKLNKKNIHEDSVESLFTEVLVYDDDDVLLAAFTTDPSRDEEEVDTSISYQVWKKEDKIGIRSIDYSQGFVDLEGFKLKSAHKIISTYYYVEKSYEFTDIDFNPVNNPSILSQRISLFIVPDVVDQDEAGHNLHYLISDHTGRVIESDWEEFDNGGPTRSGIALFYEEPPSFVSGLFDNFINKFSVEQSGTFLVLGDVGLSEHLDPVAGVNIDTRIRGGGIKEDRLNEMLVTNPESMWFWDVGFWDGMPYPGVANFYVEVPVEVLEDAGGEFRSNEIRDIVNKHTALGVYPVVKAYGVDPVVSGVFPTASGVTLYWSDHGS